MPAAPAQAQITDCSVSVSPNSVAPGSDNTFTFGLYNPNADPIQWIKITRPAGGYVALESGSAWSWQADLTADSVTFSQGSLPHAYSQGLQVQALAQSSPGGPVNWVVQISDQSDGSNAYTCANDNLGLTIQTQPSVINITNVHVSNVTSSTVTVLWDTDTASTSRVDYGLDESYGESTDTSPALTTSHNVTLTGLSQNTAYHFAVTSTTPADGGTATSGDNTFLTAVPEPPSGTSSPGSTASSRGSVPGVSIKAVPAEHVPPTVKITTDLSHAFKQPPVISGAASDNAAVARLEYSTNGGHDWLPADNMSSRDDGRTVTFRFTPIIIDDGNYQIVARATDSSGNQATTPKTALIIDRLPPQVGPLTIAYGPEVLTPDEQGITHLVSGSDYRITTSTVGGSVSATLRAGALGHAPDGPSFALTGSADSSLWRGIISFKSGGIYQITADTVDGAGNHTSRAVLTVAVTPAGHVTDNAPKRKPLANAQVTLYYLEPSTHAWQVWDGAPYGQANPQTTSPDGSYSLVVPEGRYYVRVAAQGRNTYVSNIFTATRPLGLTAEIALSPRAHLGALYLPDLPWASRPLRFNTIQTIPTANLLIGTLLTDFSLPTTSGSTLRAIDLLAKPTVVTVLSTWSPASQSQLPSLAQAQADQDVNVVPIFIQQSSGSVSSYLATGGYNLTGLIDADGQLVPTLAIGALPEHIFVDRTGHVKKIMLKVLSKEELFSQLGGL